MYTSSAADWPRLSRGLYSVAMAMFVVTVGIGIANGLDVVDFSPPEMRNTLLTHVHSGTLGWITLAIVATAFWLARAGDRTLAWAFGIVVPIYVIAFYSGNYPARAISGTVVLVLIAWLLVWIWRVALARRSLPTLAVALGLTTFAYGAVIGVLIQIQFATATNLFPAGGDAIGAHAATMAFGYLVLVAMGFVEWRLLGTTDRPRLGLVQVGALFLGAIVLALALLVGNAQAVQAAGGVNLLLTLLAIVVFAGRILPVALRTDWMAARPVRHVHAAALFIVVAAALFMYVIYLFITTADPTKIPFGVVTAFDHSVFVGVLTNLILGMTLTLAADRADRWPWVDQLVFWVVNVGVVIFVVGLVAASPEIKRIGAPTMGIGILVGLATVAVRLWSSDLHAAGAEAQTT
ncbi:MAG: hypothetical protein ABI628_07850 [Chloroflexota bacterium]